MEYYYKKMREFQRLLQPFHQCKYCNCNSYCFITDKNPAVNETLSIYRDAFVLILCYNIYLLSKNIQFYLVQWPISKNNMTMYTEIIINKSHVRAGMGMGMGSF